MQAPASFGEAWLEARGSAPYDLVRVFRKDIDFRQDLVRDLESLYERAERLRAASGQRKALDIECLFVAGSACR